MKVLVIQNCKTEGIGLYENYLIDNKIDYTFFHAYKNGRFPPSNNYDAFIIGGTPISAYEVHKQHFLRKEWRYLKRVVALNNPCFGICFGGQLLARLSGAKIRKNPVMEIGGYDVKLTSYGKKDSLFKGFPDTFPVFHWHGDTFDIPKNTKLLVKGKDCKNQAFRYENTIAVQFHLEIISKDASKWTDKYSDELKRINKTKRQVVQECRMREKEMKKLTYLLFDNFFRMVKNGRYAVQI